MTAATIYDSDRCPACGSDEALPYAVIIGATETYGYQCLSCAVTWPVIHTTTPLIQAAALPAVKGRTA